MKYADEHIASNPALLLSANDFNRIWFVRMGLRITYRTLSATGSELAPESILRFWYAKAAIGQ